MTRQEAIDYINKFQEEGGTLSISRLKGTMSDKDIIAIAEQIKKLKKEA